MSYGSQNNSLLLASLERWSRIHSGGFIKAVKELAIAKRDLECIENFKKFHSSPPSVLHDSELHRRAKVRIDKFVSEQLEILHKTLNDFTHTVEYTKSFAPEIADLMFVELGLRSALVDDLDNTWESEVLSQLVVLTFELENFLCAKIAILNCNLIPPTMDELKNFLRTNR
jgi:hypothetical protein